MKISTFTISSVCLALIACGDKDEERTGSSCESADDCFVDVDHEELSGAVECLDRVQDGYCTHLCETDDDCCAVDGECLTDFRQVCAPFESADDKRCFLACETDDIGDLDENDYCAENANDEFTCRSTGGGSENRKVCVPND